MSWGTEDGEDGRMGGGRIRLIKYVYCCTVYYSIIVYCCVYCSHIYRVVSAAKGANLKGWRSMHFLQYTVVYASTAVI